MPQEEASLTASPAARSVVVEAALRALCEAGAAVPRVVIDGRSGAGKTSAARALAEAWPSGSPCRLVSLDEFYPGWSGLGRGAEIAEALLVAHAEGRLGRYRRWDWEEDAWAAEAAPVDPAVPLIVEGCGALTPHGARCATVSIWMDGDARLRRDRAMARDGDGFAPFWEMWAAQEEAHIIAHAPRAHAMLVFDAR